MDELKRQRETGRRAALHALIGCAIWASCATLVGVAQAAPAARAKTGYAKVERVCAPPAPGEATCFALVREPVSPADAARSGVRPYALGDGASQPGPAGGLTPAELASGYGYDPSTGGAGQTVAIVDAYDDPSIETDLAEFDGHYGLSSCTHSNGCFTKISQTGSEAFLPEADTSGWSVEISLDVEAVHAACPNCKILLVEAKSPSLANLAAAVNEAVSMKATEVSNSYGGPEGSLGSAELNAYNHPGVVITAATGDDGYYDWTSLNEGFIPPNRPNLPSTLPSVVSVGGTSLRLNEAGRRTSETVWNGTGPLDSGAAEGATGGGCSTMFTGQLWQRETPGFPAAGCGSKRLAADVSAVADPLTGFDIYDSYNCGSACEEFKRGRVWLTIGGTSLATPLISALFGLAGGSGGVEYPALTLYGHLGKASSAFDVTQGGNGICDDGGLSCGANAEFTELAEAPVIADCEGTTACNATAGYDGPSGVGAPNSLSLFAPVLPTAVITAPHEPHAGAVSSFNASTSSDPFPGGSIEHYVWSWGDGSPDSSSPAPTHDYAAPGEYMVTLTVSDDYGQSSQAASAVIDVAKAGTEGGGGGGNVEPQAPAGSGGDAVAPVEVAGSVGVAGFKGAAAPTPIARLAGTSIQVGPSGSFTIKISCPAGPVGCAGTVTLRALTAVPAGAAKRLLTLAAGDFKLAAGKTTKLILRLSRRARLVIARSRLLRARVTIQTGTQRPVLSLATLHAFHRR